MASLGDYMGDRREAAPHENTRSFSFRRWLEGPEGRRLISDFGRGEDIELTFRMSTPQGETVTAPETIQSPYGEPEPEPIRRRELTFGERVEAVAREYPTYRAAAESMGISESYLYQLRQRTTPPGGGSDVPRAIRRRENYYSVGNARPNPRGRVTAPTWRPPPMEVRREFLSMYFQRLRSLFADHGSTGAVSVA